ncbi:MAG: hypothetical protein K8L99_34810 [Anaerolineae bacterium]|nr:hypothetical protein [Anaerolineae bacterium]
MTYREANLKNARARGKNTPMRLDEATKRVINMIAGEMQRETGETTSFNDALWAFLCQNRPDLAEEALTIIERENNA